MAKFSGGSGVTAYGLTQWDYGQELVIECSSLDIPDGTEVSFYQGPLSSLGYLKNRHVLIPDLMLQNEQEITAYAYVRAEGRGETILTIRLPIRARPRPEHYILPEYKEYKRLLPNGGTKGQALVKRSEIDYDTEWSETTFPEDMKPMTDDEIDNLFKEEGEEIII